MIDIKPFPFIIITKNRLSPKWFFFHTEGCYVDGLHIPYSIELCIGPIFIYIQGRSKSL